MRLVKLVAPADGCSFRDHTGKEYSITADRSIDVPEDMAAKLLAEGFKRATTAEIVLMQGPRGDAGLTGKQGEPGPRGLQGPRGPIGPMPRHQWEGTALRFEIAPGEWGSLVDLRGPQGESGQGTTSSGGVFGAGSVTLGGGTTLNPIPSIDGGFSGVEAAFVYGGTIIRGDPVYLASDGTVKKADANGTGTYPAIGLAGATASGGSHPVFMHGIYRDDSFAWATIGGLVFLSTGTNGLLTQTPPSATDDVIQIIGVATHANRLYVKPELTYLTHI